MSSKRLLILVFLMWLSASLIEVRPQAPMREGGSYNPPRSARTKYNFNSGWRLFVGDQEGAEATAFDDSGWTEVTLPHAWNEDAAFKVGPAKPASA